MQSMHTATATEGGQRENERLIASDKVEHTSVRRPNGDKIGSIHRVMIDKRSGRVAYAVMSFGGFMGMGKEYYALPWASLEYNENLDAYELDVTEEQLRGAPESSADDEFDWSNRRWGQQVHDYYQVPPYWL